ncbi:aminotransferase class I/II-fold pyridoxal phosphate-dependent enzyme [Flavobacteriaceae bacterium]|jgi:threonine aldolase|nr:aminotransferase class I/II-fold pyridoxal phosphate-dependent enzyme [Flavobacteriaceae bacterium]
MKVNLISDTVTKPSKEMLEAMIAAEVGDDVFKEDPSVNKLEKEVAALFGMEAALFFPSGTMTNQTAIKIHTQPGDQLICDHYAHVYNYEGGGVSFNSGVSCRLIPGNRGRITADQIKKVINPPDFYHSPKTTLVCLENTTNKGGGAVYDFDEIIAIKELCDQHNLALHLDGARLWNALEVTKETPADFGRVFDTISVCLSKGLGCPVGSLLLGSKQHIKQAIRYRKILGGGMRQVGYLAAAGIYAINHQLKDLKEDHRKAKELGDVLQMRDFVKNIEPVATNILIFSLIENISESEFIKDLNKNGIDIISLGKGKLRMVTHRDYTQNHHDYVLTTLIKMNGYA